MQAKTDQASTGNTEMEKNQNCSQTHKVKPREEVGKVRDFSCAYICANRVKDSQEGKVKFTWISPFLVYLQDKKNINKNKECDTGFYLHPSSFHLALTQFSIENKRTKWVCIYGCAVASGRETAGICLARAGWEANPTSFSVTFRQSVVQKGVSKK